MLYRCHGLSYGCLVAAIKMSMTPIFSTMPLCNGTSVKKEQRKSFISPTTTRRSLEYVVDWPIISVLTLPSCASLGL